MESVSNDMESEEAVVGSRKGVGFESVVQFGHTETWYRRAGRGRPLLLLVRVDRAVRDVLFRRLAAEYLVVEPEVVPDQSAWRAWLVGVVDGLGLDRPLLLVDRMDLEEAEGFARDDPDRAGGVLLAEDIDR